MNGFWPLALAQLWQVTAVILIVAALARLFARQRPHLAHGLWLVVLLKCVTPPLLSSPSGVFCWLQVSSAESDIRETAEVDSQLSSSETGDGIQTESNRQQASGDSKAELLVNQHEWQNSIEFEPRDQPEAWLTHVTIDKQAAVAVDRPLPKESASAAGEETPIESPVTRGQEVGHSPTSDGLFALFVCWLVGTATIATVSGLRWCLFLYSLNRKGWCRDESLELLIRNLSRKLGVRRRVRLIVTFGRIGPAVIGIFRPTVLLPSVIVEGKSPKELEPILAHELMHFRRGDLWVGMLQVLAQAVWWFHPLVWLVNRLVTRDAERCCDEAVIARLGCDPLRYARSLVDVLELKQSLKPVPVVPGVRPVEVTSKRLERIMTLGQGSLKRSPWWCWAVMLAATLLLLPGAAFVADAKDKSKNRRSRSRKTLDRSAQKQTDKHANDRLVTRNYPVGDVFKVLQSQFSLNENQIRELLGKETMRVAGGTWSKPNGSDVDFDEQGNVTITDTTVIPGSATPQLWYKGKTLVVRHTREAHRRISRHLEIERKYGYDEIEIETRIVTVDRKHLDALGINWTILDVDVPAREVHPSQPSNVWQPLDRPFPEEGAKPQSLARTIVDKNTPVTQATVDNVQLDDMTRLATASVLMMPKITCLNGRSVTVQDSVQRPFVVSLRRVEGEGKHAYQPRIRVVTEGITMRLRPVLLPDDKVWLDFELTMSEILGVESVQVQTGEKSPPSVQVPEVATRLINSALALPPGKSLIIGGLTKKGAKDKPQALLVVLRASKKALEEAGTKFVPAIAFESNSVKPRIIAQAEEEDNTIHHKSSRFDKFTQLARDLKKAAFGSDEPQDPYSEERLASDRRPSARASDHQLLDEPHSSDGSIKTLVQRLDKLEWTYGLPAGAAIQETKEGYQVTASPWRTTFKGEDGKLTTMFSAEKGNLVVGKGDNAEITLELVGNMNWQIDCVRVFAQRGVWSNTAKQRYVLTGNVRFVDNEKRIQLTADKASFDSNRIFLEGNAQIQRLTNGKTDHMTADRIEWHVDKNAFNAVGTVLFRTTDKKNKTVSAPSEAQAASTSSPADKGESRTGRLMFGVGVNSDAGVTSSIVIDENVQPASAVKRIEGVPVASLQQLVEQFNELMDEQRYVEAEAVARQAKNLEPDNPVVRSMVWKVYFARRTLRRENAPKTLPSPNYLEDDVQYFPAGPEFKLGKENTPRLERYVRATVFRPIVQKCEQDLVPTDAEVLQALEKQRQLPEGGLALLAKKHIDNVRIVKEKIADYLDPPKAARSVGTVEAHHTHYKCTVYFGETKQVAWPIPHKSSEDIVEVVYLDVVHNHRLHEWPDPVECFRGEPAKNISPEEARIRKMLQQKIDVKYSETPFHEFAEDIGRRAGVNVHLDRRGLEAEGITGNELITLKIKQPISARSALNLVLPDLHLAYVIEDEVVKITREQTGHEVYSKVYNVADLVVPIPEVVHLTNDDKQLQPKEVKADFSTLFDAIFTTVAPESWDKAGGPGVIQSFDTNLSVVVSQSKEVHEQIAELLKQLRRLQDVQVTCELRTVTMDQASYEAFWDEPLKDSATILSPTETFFLLQAFNDKEKINLSIEPKITLFPGQHLITSIDYQPNQRSSFREQLHLVPTVSDDRRSVTLACATVKDVEQFNEKNEKKTLADGHTLLLDVTSQLSPSDAKTLNKRVFVMVTPHIVVQEEELGE